MALLAVQLVFPALSSADDSFGLKGDRLNMTLSAFKERHDDAICSDESEVSSLSPSVRNIGLINCRAIPPHVKRRGVKETVANVPATITYYFISTDMEKFDIHLLRKIEASFDHAGYARVREAMGEKYGPADSVEHKRIQNMRGVSVKSEDCIWNKGDSQIRIVEHVDRLNRSALIFLELGLDNIFHQRKSSAGSQDIEDL
ncbi:hypothetical protein P8631_01055 [Guyparkeria sp. 1SP6A2]|nr:hypothetical protein [Guyparkeria sp. 1SP6A2]